MTKNIPSAPYVCLVWISDATTDITYITNILPHTTVLAKTESLKCIIEGVKLSFTSDTKGVFKDELDAREICGTGFFQSNVVLY